MHTEVTTSLMERSIRDRWIARLRSGHYKQGYFNLCVINNETGEESYCCLGVLNDMLNTPFRIHDIISGETHIEYANSPVGTPVEELSWDSGANTNRLADYGLRGPELRELVIMNDLGRSFKEIADWIEKNIATKHTAACDDEDCPDHGIMSVNNGD